MQDEGAPTAADTEKAEKKVLADKLLAEAKKAAEDAAMAEQRLKDLKSGTSGTPLSELAKIARKNKLEKEAGRLQRESDRDREEAAKLEREADQAEKVRGTTTVAQRLSEKSQMMEDNARVIDQKAQRILGELEGIEGGSAAAAPAGGGSVARDSAPLTRGELVTLLKGVSLVPSSGSRTDISRVVGVLDELKRDGQLRLWSSADDGNAGGFRGPSSSEVMMREMGLEEGEADVKMGITNYKALQLKNKVMGGFMMTGGLGLLLAGSAGERGGAPLGLGLVYFGYFALLVNFTVGLFGAQANDWLSKKLYDLNIDQYRERSIACEAAHLMVSYLCGLPIQEYLRDHQGYPIKDKPLGRCQIYSSRRGDPAVAPRSRPFGLPPWASLEVDVEQDDMMSRIDIEPIRNGYTPREIDHLSMVLMAGPVAEYLRFGSSSNGATVFQQLDTCMLMSQSAIPADKMQAQARWAIIRVSKLLKKHDARLTALTEAMQREASLVECLAIIESG